MMTLVASALAGGDCIDDADVLRAGGTARVLGFTAKAPSTLGTFLRSFRWGHVRQLDRVSRELLARVWKAGAGPGDAPFTIDLDSTICETYGLAKEGARHHGYTGARGYHPLLAVAAGTGDVLMARLREGRANTARGAAHFLRETVGRVRYCGARGQLTVRADSGFYTHAVVAVCRRMDVRFSIAKQYHEIFADSVLPARPVLETRSIVLQAGSDRTSCSSMRLYASCCHSEFACSLRRRRGVVRSRFRSLTRRTQSGREISHRRLNSRQP